MYGGSHLDAAEKRRVTVVYDTRDAQQAEAIARARRVKPSAIYRNALARYLATQA